MTYRNTYYKINLNNLEYNIKTIINEYDEYKYYIGVVKADCYGFNGKEIIETIINSGVNYLAVSSLDEALEIRKYSNIPILCLGIINYKYIDICEKNNIDITVTNLEYLKNIKSKKINIHIKIDTGMNRLGVKTKNEFNEMIKYIKENKLNLKGLFTHIYNANKKIDTNHQINKFMEITHDINLSEIDMIHIAQSETLVNYPKIKFANACRLGIIMYGFSNKLELKSIGTLCSEVIEIKKIQKGETVSYNKEYKCDNDELIAIVSIGYADGINRKLKGSYVIINDKKYEIIGNICMDMMMVKIDETVKLNDTVYIYKDNEHIKKQSAYLNTIPYELLCMISKRVPRIYIKE